MVAEEGSGALRRGLSGSLLEQSGMMPRDVLGYEGQLVALLADGVGDGRLVGLCREVIEANHKLERENTDLRACLRKERSEREHVVQMLQAQQGLLSGWGGASANQRSPSRRPAVATPGGMRQTSPSPGGMRPTSPSPGGMRPASPAPTRPAAPDLAGFVRELEEQLVHMRRAHPVTHLPQGVQTLVEELEPRDPHTAAAVGTVCGKVASLVDEVMDAATKAREETAHLRGTLAGLLRKLEEVPHPDASSILPSPGRASPILTPPSKAADVSDSGALADAVVLCEKADAAVDRIRGTHIVQLRNDIARLSPAGAVQSPADLLHCSIPQLLDQAAASLLTFVAEADAALKREHMASPRRSRSTPGRGQPPSAAGRAYLRSLSTREAAVEKIWDLDDDVPVLSASPDHLIDGVRALRREWDAMKSSQGEGARQQALSVLRRLSTPDAGRLASAGTEAILRTVSGHVDNLQVKASARGHEAALRRSMSHIDEMISALLEHEPTVTSPPREASPGSPPRRSTSLGLDTDPEGKMATLQRAYHEKKDRLGRFGALVRRCEHGVELMCSHLGVPCSFPARDGQAVQDFDAAYKPLIDALDAVGDAVRRREKAADASTAGKLKAATEAAFETRRMYELVKVAAGEHADLSFSFSAEAHDSFQEEARLAVLAADDKGPIDFADFEGAVTSLGQRVKDAELTSSTLKTQLRYYIARVQSLIQTYDYRPPAQRHVHIGDVLDADLLRWGEQGGPAAPPGIRDLEELLVMLVKGGGDAVSSRDAVLDSVETDLRLVLPQVESMLGVSALPDDVAYTAGSFSDPHSRLCATMARWKRVMEYHRQTRVQGAAAAERVLLCTIQHATARLKAAVDNLAFSEDPSFAPAPPPDVLGADAIDLAVSDLDHYTVWGARILERLAGERAFVLSAVEAMASTAAAEREVLPGSPQKVSLAPLFDTTRPEQVAQGLVDTAQGAVRAVGDLSAHYTRVMAKHKRMAEAVCVAAAQLDKLLHPQFAIAGALPEPSTQTYLADVAGGAPPERLLADAVARVTGRAKGMARAKDGGWVGVVAVEKEVSPPRRQGGRASKAADSGDAGVLLPPRAWGMVKQLALAAPAGATVAEVIEHVATRIAAGDSDRAVLRKEVERARKAWRAVHDDVVRRLLPLLPQDTAPPPTTTENQLALVVISKVEQQVATLTKQQQHHSNELSGQKARRLDLDARLKGIKSQQAKMAKDVSRICMTLSLTPIPVAGEPAPGSLDVEATLRAVADEVVHTAAAAAQLGDVRTRATEAFAALERDRHALGRADKQVTQLAAYTADTLAALGICVDADAVSAATSSPMRRELPRRPAPSVSTERDTRGSVARSTRGPSGSPALPQMSLGKGASPELLAAAAGMATAARAAKASALRTETCEALIDSLLREMKDYGARAKDAVSAGAQSKVPEFRYSLSPMTSASGVSVTPSRQAPPPPLPHDEDGSPAPAWHDNFERRCEDAMAFVRHTAAAATEGAQYRSKYDAAHAALQDIAALCEANKDKVTETAPHAVAQAVTERIDKLLEASAANAEEKAKLIRQNLELKQENDGLAEELGQMQQDVRDLDARKHQLKRQVESAKMFVAYAKEMKADADHDAERAPGSDQYHDDGLFDETVAVQAYQGYLALRKQRETLQKRVTELEEEAEDAQLQHEFLGGIAAKLASLGTLCEDTAKHLTAAPSEDGSVQRAPSRSPPPPPAAPAPEEETQSVPTRILASLSLLERHLLGMQSGCGGLGKRASKVIGGLRKLVAEHGPAAAAREAIQGSINGLPLPQGVRCEDLETLWGRVEGLLGGVSEIPQHMVQTHEKRLRDEQRRTEEAVAQVEMGLQRERALQAEIQAEVAARKESAMYAVVASHGASPRRRFHTDGGFAPSELSGSQRRSMSSHASPQRQPRLAVSGAGGGYADRHARRRVSPSRSPERTEHAAAATSDSDAALMQCVRALEDMVGKVHSAAPVRRNIPGYLQRCVDGPSTDGPIAAYLLELCTAAQAEMTSLLGDGAPRSGTLLERMRDALEAAPVHTVGDDEWLEGGIKDVAAQLTQLANNIAAGSARECTKLLLRSAETSNEDHLGLLAGIRRLHVIIANKIEAPLREAKDWRAKHDLLDARVTGLQTEADRHRERLAFAGESGRQAEQALGIQKAQWEQAKRALEGKVTTLEAAQNTLQEQLDAAQCTLALQRSKLAQPSANEPGSASAAPAPTTVTATARESVGDEVLVLREEVQLQTQRCDEAREYVEEMEALLQEQEQGKREYKEKYKRALEEVAKLEEERDYAKQSFKALEEERNTMKQSFKAQICLVKDQLVKLHAGRQSKASSVSLQGDRPSVSRPETPSRSSSTPARPSPSARAASRSTDSITVPRAFNFTKSRGRTGCHRCDSPDGPSKYSGSAPPARQQSQRDSHQP